MSTTRPDYGTGLARVVAAEQTTLARRFGLGQVAALLVLWYERARQRSQLAELDDHLLKDIGKTRKQAIVEAGKPFWQP